MPLEKSSSDQARSRNIAELHHSNPDRPLKQDIAIAYSVQRESERKEHEKRKYGR